MGNSGLVCRGTLAGIIEGGKLGEILEMCWRRSERRKSWVSVRCSGIAESGGALFAEHSVAEKRWTLVFRYAIPNICGDQARGIETRYSDTEISGQPKQTGRREVIIVIPIPGQQSVNIIRVHKRRVGDTQTVNVI